MARRDEFLVRPRLSHDAELGVEFGAEAAPCGPMRPHVGADELQALFAEIFGGAGGDPPFLACPHELGGVCDCGTAVEDEVRRRAGIVPGAAEGPHASVRRDEDLARRIRAFHAARGGNFCAVFHEPESWLVHLEVLAWGPAPGHPYYDFATSGMSARPMRVPEGDNALPDRVELALRLDATRSRTLPPMIVLHLPPIPDLLAILFELARLPHETQRHVTHGHIVQYIGEEESDDDQGMLLMDTARWGRPVAPCRLASGDPVHLLHVIPLRPSELRFARAEGAGALIERLERAGVDEVLRPSRDAAV